MPALNDTGDRNGTSKAGIVLGMGLGGFVDGIALHQIAQWHNMGSAILPPPTMDAMRQNMAWDGYSAFITCATCPSTFPSRFGYSSGSAGWD